MKKAGGDKFYNVIAIFPLLLFFLFFLLPLFLVLSKAFTVNNQFSLNNLTSILSSEYTYRILRFTVIQSLLSAAFSIIIAFPGAYYFSNYKSRIKKIVLSLSTLCFTLPSILVVLSFVIFYGNAGFFNSLLKTLFNSENIKLKILYTFKAIILAHAFLNVPVALSLITDYYSNLNKNAEKAAALLGAKQIRIFFTITLPRLLPAFLSAFLLIFLFCFSSFAIILVLGGGPEFTTIEVEIYRQAKISLNFEKASSFAVISLLCNFTIVIFTTISSKKLTYEEEKNKVEIKKLENKPLQIVFFVYFSLLFLFVLAPLLFIIFRSFISTSARTGTVFTINQYLMLFGKIRASSSLSLSTSAIINSLLIATCTAVLSTLFAIFISLFIANKKNKTLDIILMLPLSVSSVIIGLGFLIIKSLIPYYSDFLGYILVIIAHIILTLPFAIKTILPGRLSLDTNFLNCAYTLGDSKLNAAIKLEIPQIASSVFKAFAFTFALSMGEVNATIILAEGKLITLPVLLYRLIGAYNFQGACALGTLLITVTFTIFILSMLFDRENKK